MSLFDAAAVLSASGVSVGPLAAWSRVRESTIALLVEEGLQPHHKVVDLGCGHLRIGSWLIPYLEPGRYIGIEPREEAVKAGLRALVGLDVAREKAVVFSDRTDFDVGAWGPVDFVVARSVWSHASRDQIRATLDAFMESAQRGGKLLASFYPASLRRPGFWPYYGSEWCYEGASKRPASAHWRGFIRRECRRRGLRVRLRRFPGVHQEWCIITGGAR